MCNVSDRLAGLSSAEEIFAAVGVPFDQEVLNVHRLHILARFRHHLERLRQKASNDHEPSGICRQALELAYGEFTPGGSAPKTFKVFKDAAPAFVPLTELARPGSQGPALARKVL